MPIRIVFFDCDGTLTNIKSSWEYLHRRLNLWENKADAYQTMFRNGDIGYDEFCKLDALLWKGLPVSKVDEIVGDIPLRDGAVAAVRSLKRQGVYTVIISSGLSFLVNRVKQLLHIDRAFSNELEVADGQLTGKAIINVSYNCKGPLVRGLLDSMALSKTQACAVGDGDGDAGMFEAVGLPIHLHPEDSFGGDLNSRPTSLLTAVDLISESGW